ncbi:MAG TPA: hypothetical protein VKS43_08730 [Burkholderiales bacterium]|nr:hypothetical protein [Burkholderiales bacterium]
MNGRSVMAIVIGLAFSAGALAQSMSKDQYQSGKDDIAATYKAAAAACGSFAANAKDICQAEADGKRSVAKADLEARYKPSVDASYNVRVARADADYSVAREKCDDKAGNVKDVCVKEAKANSIAAKADAKAWMKTANADQAATDKGNAARKDATSDKRDADYAVAREKCDAFAGNVKDNCVSNAKAKFGKS